MNYDSIIYFTIIICFTSDIYAVVLTTATVLPLTVATAHPLTFLHILKRLFPGSSSKSIVVAGLFLLKLELLSALSISVTIGFC